MKNIQKLMLLMIVSASSLFAENKDIIYIINHYGQDVSVDLKWYPKPASYSVRRINSQKFMVYENDVYDDTLTQEEFDHDFGHKAPVSLHYLQEILVQPAMNVYSQGQATQMAPSYEELSAHDWSSTPYTSHIPIHNNAIQSNYGMNGRVNEAKINFSKPDKPSLVFVIEQSHKDSRIPNQKQIKILKFASRDAYKKHLERIEAETKKLQKSQSAPRLSPEFINHYYGGLINDNDDDNDSFNYIYNN